MVKQFMKGAICILILTFQSFISFGQVSQLDSSYSVDVCKCLDSLKQKSIVTDDNFLTCFQVAIEKSASLFISESLKKYGDTTEQSGVKLGKEIMERLTISLVNSCETYFILVDSLRYNDYIGLNKDSLKKEIKNLENTAEEKRSKEFYENRQLLYFQLGLYNQSLNDIEKVLALDATNIQSLVLKAWIYEINGNYKEAIILYQKTALLTNMPSFNIFTEVAKRKLRSNYHSSK